jgi:Zn-dependent protease
MLNEPASSPDNRPVLNTAVAAPMVTNKRHDELRTIIETVMNIDQETFYAENAPPDFNIMIISPESRPMATFSGQLLLESEEAYQRLDELCAPLDLLPAFRENTENNASPHIIHVLRGRANPKPRSWIINLVLFLLTIVTVLLVGTGIAMGSIFSEDPETLSQADTAALATLEQCFQTGAGDLCYIPEIVRGIPYAASLLLILGAHELGHYFLARRHNLAVTLPYFIPFPGGFFGTMGAFIQLRQPMRNRKALLDIGAAGPLIGLCFAIPILIIGIATSPVKLVTEPGLVEGNSFLYALLKTIILGRFYPSGGEDMFMNQLAQAGWTGLFVTALNLIPVGQLDGGHTLYSLIGNRARRLYYPLLIVMIGLCFLSEVWILWVILLFLFGRMHATPLDELTPLDPRRRYVAMLALFVFAVIFVPVPFTLNDPALGTLMLPAVMATVWLHRNSIRLHM